VGDLLLSHLLTGPNLFGTRLWELLKVPFYGSRHRYLFMGVRLTVNIVHFETASGISTDGILSGIHLWDFHRYPFMGAQQDIGALQAESVANRLLTFVSIEVEGTHLWGPLQVPVYGQSNRYPFVGFWMQNSREI